MNVLAELAKIPIGSYAAWGVIIAVGASGLIQIAPVKINPWTRIARSIGKAINGDILRQVNQLEQEIADLRNVSNEREAKEDERNAKNARQRILRFGDEIRHGQLHSEEHYDDIMSDITDYENYCTSHPNFKNQKAKSTIKIIAEAYEQHVKNRDFLN